MFTEAAEVDEESIKCQKLSNNIGLNMEIVDTPTVKKNPKREQTKEEIVIPEIKIGNRIEHNKFGEGIIIDIPKEGFMTVKFSNKAEKTLGIEIVFKNKIIKLI